MKLFIFSEKTERLKTKLLVLSSICLFIGLTVSLPEKVSILGLDLSNAPSVTGWFILTVSIYFMLKFLVSATLEIIGHHLPHFIIRKTKKTTGDILGLSADECHSTNEEQLDLCNNEIGTPAGELKSIEKKNQEINIEYNRKYISLSNVTSYIVDLLLPLIMFIAGATYLFKFLKSLS